MPTFRSCGSRTMFPVFLTFPSTIRKLSRLSKTGTLPFIAYVCPNFNTNCPIVKMGKTLFSVCMNRFSICVNSPAFFQKLYEKLQLYRKLCCDFFTGPGLFCNSGKRERKLSEQPECPPQAQPGKLQRLYQTEKAEEYR